MSKFLFFFDPLKIKEIFTSFFILDQLEKLLRSSIRDQTAVLGKCTHINRDCMSWEFVESGVSPNKTLRSIRKIVMSKSIIRPHSVQHRFFFFTTDRIFNQDWVSVAISFELIFAHNLLCFIQTAHI